MTGLSADVRPAGPFPNLSIASWNARAFMATCDAKVKHNNSFAKFMLGLAPILLLQEVKGPLGCEDALCSAFPGYEVFPSFCSGAQAGVAIIIRENASILREKNASKS